MIADARTRPCVFEYHQPAISEVPVVVSAPHTGTFVPPEIKQQFASERMHELPMTDWYVERLYDFLPTLGAHFIHARVSRLVIDLNRAPDSRPLYSGRFETGLIASRTFQGERIFRTAPDDEETRARKRAYYEPYHQRLQELLEDVRQRFGVVYLLDAHSVASGPSLLHGPLGKDIYLGNRDGTTSEDWLFQFLFEQFVTHDFTVSLNDPYKGGFITAHYGQQRGVQAVQIEMCQRVYMDEDKTAGGPEYPALAPVSGTLKKIFTALISEISSRASGDVT